VEYLGVTIHARVGWRGAHSRPEPVYGIMDTRNRPRFRDNGRVWPRWTFSGRFVHRVENTTLGFIPCIPDSHRPSKKKNTQRTTLEHRNGRPRCARGANVQLHHVVGGAHGHQVCAVSSGARRHGRSDCCVCGRRCAPRRQCAQRASRTGRHTHDCRTSRRCCRACRARRPARRGTHATLVFVGERDPVALALLTSLCIVPCSLNAQNTASNGPCGGSHSGAEQ
jgi:hypothetical protein